MTQGKSFFVAFGGIIIVVVLVVMLVSSFSLGGFPRVQKDKWQAIFLNNNQVYFGKIRNVSGDYIALSSIFYLQAVQPLQQGSQVPPPQLTLVKLGSELHGPEDTMYIPKGTVLFWENMREDSEVVKKIKESLGS